MDVIYYTCSEVDSYCFAGIPFAGPPWLYSTLRLWNHRGESYELATTPGCLLFQQQESRGPPTPQKFIIRISPISDWVWQKSSRKIEIIPKLTKKKKVSFLPSPPPLANPIWPMGVQSCMMIDRRSPCLPPPSLKAIMVHLSPSPGRLRSALSFPNNKSRYILLIF